MLVHLNLFFINHPVPIISRIKNLLFSQYYSKRKKNNINKTYVIFSVSFRFSFLYKYLYIPAYLFIFVLLTFFYTSVLVYIRIAFFLNQFPFFFFVLVLSCQCLVQFWLNETKNIYKKKPVLFLLSICIF